MQYSLKTCLSALLILIASIGSFAFAEGNEKNSSASIKAANAKFKEYSTAVYTNLQTSSTLPPQDVFHKALKGYGQLVASAKVSKRIITVVDFRMASNKKRLWVIDLDKQKVLLNTYVAHGQGTGTQYAKKFSNIPESHQSSLGFYVTGEKYYGKHGLSLRLDGAEAGYNDLARPRAIVIHGADYANESFIKQHGRLGRSYGCPAVPSAVNDKLVNLIAEKSCLFIYYPDAKYEKASKLINAMPNLALATL